MFCFYFESIDMDAKSLQLIGRWPWSREKHIPSILAAKEHGMDALAFDIFFISWPLTSESKYRLKLLEKKVYLQIYLMLY